MKWIRFVRDGVPHAYVAVRRVQVMVMSLVMVLLWGAAAFASESITVTRRDRLYDVKFVGDHVWVVGFPGLILHSADRGKTWEHQQGAAKEFLFAVDFVDESTGWIVGRSGLVLHTADGGKTWVKQTVPTKEHLFDVRFVDAKTGWAVGNFAVVVRTLDGGKTWEKVQVGAGALSAPQADAAQQEEDDEEYEYDGDWGDDDGEEEGPEEEGNKEPGKDSGEEAQVIEGEFDRLLNGVYAFSADRAIAAGESGAIIETVDGGKTWKLIPSGEWAPLFKVDFVTSDVGYVVGAQGAVLRTADSGKTWKRVETGTTDHVFRFVVKDGRMMAVGHRGVVLVGDPESGALERQALGVYGWISGIGLGPEKTGVMVGGQGLFWRTEDGGKTWQPVVDTH